jgi:hypothetical protein
MFGSTRGGALQAPGPVLQTAGKTSSLTPVVVWIFSFCGI